MWHVGRRFRTPPYSRVRCCYQSDQGVDQLPSTHGEVQTPVSMLRSSRQHSLSPGESRPCYAKGDDVATRVAACRSSRSISWSKLPRPKVSRKDAITAATALGLRTSLDSTGKHNLPAGRKSLKSEDAVACMYPGVSAAVQYGHAFYWNCPSTTTVSIHRLDRIIIEQRRHY
jgi:hypothetical protein